MDVRPINASVDSGQPRCARLRCGQRGSCHCGLHHRELDLEFLERDATGPQPRPGWRHDHQVQLRDRASTAGFPLPLHGRLHNKNPLRHWADALFDASRVCPQPAGDFEREFDSL